MKPEAHGSVGIEIDEPIVDIYWEMAGSLDAPIVADVDAHVLYMLQGRHPVLGPGLLLYVGRTERSATKRLAEHWRAWGQIEPDPIHVRVASIGVFNDWDTWRSDPRDRYPRCNDVSLVSTIERLLVYAHQPPYNSRELKDCPQPESGKHLRIFNTGRYGGLLPEVSTRRYRDVRRPSQDP